MLRISASIFIVASLFCSLAQAEIIIQDNFDSNCTGDVCSSSAAGACTSYYPDGWDQYHCEDSQPVTASGATHYGGEITATGRGGSGKSLKIWRHNGYYGNYTGPLFKIFGGSYSNIWFRYYQKIPTAFTFTGSSGFKMWRLNVTGGGGELYLNVLCPTADCASYKTWGLYDNNSWTTVLDDSALAAIWDGDWHCIQWNINIGTGAIVLYIDGTQAWSGTKSGIGGTLQYLQHFPVGNSNDDHTWVSQSSWQALEVDDLIIATTKTETDPDDAEPTPVRKLNNVTGVRVTLH